jgi:hypothetical protein
MSLFVSIAAYRDADLAKTIADCVAKARYPAELHFGICWQHAEDEPPPPDPAPARLRLIDVPWRESGGACWARAQAMSLWDGEEYFLQIDSHHRFVQDWDTLLLDQANRSAEARPLLTTYATGFDPDRPLPAADHPTAMAFHRFTPDGIPQYRSFPRPGWAGRERPVRARFASGHLLFTLGRFVEDVPYDPELYFIGEEITLAIRAFTHGYALLHPSVHIMWHEYSRRQRVMHWDDHVAGRGLSTSASERDAASLARVRDFLTTPAVGHFGCGTARSFAEYEAYAGIHFARRRVTAAARRGDEPSPPPPPGAAVGPIRDWRVRVALGRNALPPAALKAPAFWYVGFHDAAGVEIARADANHTELQTILMGGTDPIVLDRHFRAARPPASWTIWPVDRRRQWLTHFSGPVDTAQAALGASI